MSDENRGALVDMRGITRVFRTEELETYALADVHLSIDRGEFVSIAGPSGCGKSTLLAVMGLLDTPTGGEYLLDGRPVSGLSAAERTDVRGRHVGFVFQAFNLIGDLTVWENVELPLVYRGLTGSERQARVGAALERVGMLQRRSHYPHQLSGGQQQRTAVARAVVGDPTIVLADEPTGNLDSINGGNVMNLLRELHSEGATICIVTHDPSYADYAERQIRLFDGRVVDEPEGAAARPAADSGA